MRKIEFTGRFKRDYKREKRTYAQLDHLLEPVISKLANDEPLPASCFDHSLNADWKGFRDCHIRPDLVLIYQKQAGVLSLVRLGSHSELFG